MSSRSQKRRPQSDPSPEEEGRDPLVATSDPENGSLPAVEEETQTEFPAEVPAQVELKIKGSDKAARDAAKRFGGDNAKPAPVATPSNDPEPPDEDPIAALLSDGKHMVRVTRQTPRTIQGPDGQEHASNVRIPGAYTCPTSKAEIEEQVFEQYGGRKYKCTIHPDTSEGENKILGHFTIEHPDSKCPPYIDGVTINLPEPPPDDRLEIPTRGDPTLRETDQLVKLKEDAERRIERARLRKEALQMEREAKRLEAELESDGKPAPAPVQVGENEELRKLREQLAATQAQLAEKKVNDRFDKLEDSITKLASSIATLATAKPAGKSEDDLTIKMLQMSQQHSKDMLDTIKTMNKPVAVAPVDNFDAMLDRLSKMKTALGKDDSRVSEFQSRIMEAAMDRFIEGTGGDRGEGDEEEMDALKYGLKQLTPVLKTYVEKSMERESKAASGGEVSKDRMKEIYQEAATKAAQDLSEQWRKEGLVIVSGRDGRPAALPAPKKGTVPPRHTPAKVLSERRTAEGVVKTVQIEPADLSKKTTPRGDAATAEAPQKEGDDVVKYAEFPLLGNDGSTVKVVLPAHPGDIKYDRKYTVNFILDSIRSEIRQEIPQKTPNDSFVPGDALELLDDEVLSRLAKVDSGEQVEAILAEWGDHEKINEIKAAGSDEAVKSWLRRLVITIGDEYRNRTQQ